MYYKTCAVPMCKNTTIKCPNKLFICVPKCPKRRKKWLQLARRDPKYTGRSTINFCEDHFDLPNDMENYVRYTIMGSVGQIKMKPNCLPSKFACQPDRLKRTAPPKPRSAVNKRRRMDIIKEIVSETTEKPSTLGATINSVEMDEETNGIDAVKEEMTSECRTCLQTINSDADLYYIFQSWVPPWEGIDYTIAEALEKLAQVQVSTTDQHSKMICGVCCQKLYSACSFTTLIQQSDRTLRERYSTGLQTGDNWPKPIKINVNIPADDQVGVEVKQEVLSDEEYNEYTRVVEGHTDLTNLDIKIEPEELIMQQHPKVAINGHGEGSSMGDQTSEIPSLNGDDSSQDRFSVTVKEEPVSDNESMGGDLSLDCMLCAKVFNSVSGLKAHVIAHHSYKSVRRKAENEESPVKKKKHEYVCATCRRSFATSTDLMVHETCHNKSVCYGCNEKFDSFELVMQHRLTCKAVNNKGQVTVKTLEDVQRLPRPPAANEDDEEDSPMPQLKCTLCDERFTDNYYMNIHLEIHHPAERESEMEVQALESLFAERA
ncbi:uncharacterized protein [Epargyreus clarus]|uniref:uncharacterized protein isoform X2 n=1 Tax=Epargyreus clarus TaxID=520877 RepID=UPI003C2CBA31